MTFCFWIFCCSSSSSFCGFVGSDAKGADDGPPSSSSGQVHAAGDSSCVEEPGSMDRSSVFDKGGRGGGTSFFASSSVKEASGECGRCGRGYRRGWRRWVGEAPPDCRVSVSVAASASPMASAEVEKEGKEKREAEKEEGEVGGGASGSPGDAVAAAAEDKAGSPPSFSKDGI